jgi:1-phosphofructokinase family hexose kinase
LITVLSANPGMDRTYEVEGFRVGAFHHPRRFRVAPGGKGINVARVLRALGHEVTVTGLAGGTTARFVVTQLRREGIGTAFVPIAEESRLCLNIVDATRGTQTRLDEVGPLVTPSEVDRLRHTWRQLLAQSSRVVISGSAPRGVPFDLYGELILAARECGIPCVLDAHDELLRDGVQAGPTVVKPNLAELSHLAGRDLAVPEGVVAAARQLLGYGTRMVLCSLSSDGAIAVTETEGVWRAHVPPVQVVSPVGCGDASVGGYVSACEEGLPTPQCIQWALAAGSACAATFGAGFASRPDIEALVAQVRLEPLTL